MRLIYAVTYFWLTLGVTMIATAKIGLYLPVILWIAAAYGASLMAACCASVLMLPGWLGLGLAVGLSSAIGVGAASIGVILSPSVHLTSLPALLSVPGIGSLWLGLICAVHWSVTTVQDIPLQTQPDA